MSLTGNGLSSKTWLAAAAITKESFVLCHMSPILRKLLGVSQDQIAADGMTLVDLFTAPTRILFRTVLEINLRHKGFLSDAFLEFRGLEGRTIPVIASAVVNRSERSARVRWLFVYAPRRAEFERQLLQTRRELENAIQELRISNQKLYAQREEIKQQAHELFKKSQQLEHAASTDPLTGLANRRGLESGFSASNPGTGALLVVDIDRFKMINDQHGHAIGDQVLITCANVLRKTVRDTDVVARIGGEEFVVWAPRLPTDASFDFADRLRRSVATEVSSAVGFSVTVSIGLGNVTGAVFEQLWQHVAEVDRALYAAKSGGRNQVVQVQDDIPVCSATP